MGDPTDRVPAAAKPAVIVDGVHIRYRVLATGKAPAGVEAKGGLLHRARSTRTVHAVKGVSFTVNESESIGVIGSNGSGKSSLMRAITGLTPVSEGVIYAAARPSMLGVGAALIRDLSGASNVILGGLAMGFSRREIEEKFDEIVDFAGIRDFIDMPMRTYSSGMSARLKFAIATARQHEILIVDEALATGDRVFKKRSEDRIREIRNAAGTVFLVSHSMDAIRDTCARTVWLEKGQLMADGPSDDVIKAYEDHRG
jgi:teichoic acid transport system ATP-binding protein